ncbi:MAG TPA: hypothetical protein VEG67_04030 [Myxococcota bacterium]|nr:hypothetical protein [Myxococcota bacterium]
MSDQEQRKSVRSAGETQGTAAEREREAQLDAAIEATFPASDPVASFDFR